MQQRARLIRAERTLTAEFRWRAAHRPNTAAKVAVDAGVEIHRATTEW